MGNLTGQQAFALRKLRFETGNVFLTGGAGSGKSFVLKQFVADSNGKNVVVLAPTGMAALNVGGTTIHRFFELKTSTTIESLPKLYESSIETIKNTDVFVIDEISMVRADLVDVIDAILRGVMATTSPFGGKQMVFVGDPFQLPPVVSKDEKQMFLEVYRAPFFFWSNAYRSSNFLKIELSENKRQTGDADFVGILNRMRVGGQTPDDIRKLNSRVVVEGGSLDMVLLTTSHSGVDQMNNAALARIRESERHYHGLLDGSFAEGLPTDKILALKKGAKIMFVKNHREGAWVNGTTGKIVELHEDSVEVLLESGTRVSVTSETWDRTKPYYDKSKKRIEHRVLGSFTQLPIKLAWAVTIHKCQGQTLESAMIDLSGVFDVGQAYVALSRCKSLDGIRLVAPICDRHVRVDRNVYEFMVGECEDLRFQTSSEKMKILRESAQKRAKIRFEYEKNGIKQQKEMVVLGCGDKEFHGRSFVAVEGNFGNARLTFAASRMSKVAVV